MSLSGDVLTGLVGVDYAKGPLARRRRRWPTTTGTAATATTPATPDAGDLDSALVTVNPYLRYAINERLSAWGAAGYGMGTLQLRQDGRGQSNARGQSNITPDLAAGHGNEDVTLTPSIRELSGQSECLTTFLLRPRHRPRGLSPVTSWRRTMRLAMGAAGPARGGVCRTRPPQLALKTDALWVRTASAATDGMQGARADAGRLRLLLTGQHRRVLPNAALLLPQRRTGHPLRRRRRRDRLRDGTGRRCCAMPTSALGLAVETKARALLAHEDRGNTGNGA